MSKFEMAVSLFVISVFVVAISFLVSPYFDGVPGDQIMSCAIMAVDAMK